jgi:hypothetical protein
MGSAVEKKEKAKENESLIWGLYLRRGKKAGIGAKKSSIFHIKYIDIYFYM